MIHFISRLFWDSNWRDEVTYKCDHNAQVLLRPRFKGVLVSVFHKSIWADPYTTSNVIPLSIIFDSKLVNTAETTCTLLTPNDLLLAVDLLPNNVLHWETTIVL